MIRDIVIPSWFMDDVSVSGPRASESAHHLVTPRNGCQAFEMSACRRTPDGFQSNDMPFSRLVERTRPKTAEQEPRCSAADMTANRISENSNFPIGKSSYHIKPLSPPLCLSALSANFFQPPDCPGLAGVWTPTYGSQDTPSSLSIHQDLLHDSPNRWRSKH